MSLEELITYAVGKLIPPERHRVPCGIGIRVVNCSNRKNWFVLVFAYHWLRWFEFLFHKLLSTF